MKETILGNHLRKVPSIAVGCMRLSEKSKDEMNHFIHSALEQGAYVDPEEARRVLRHEHWINMVAAWCERKGIL